MKQSLKELEKSNRFSKIDSHRIRGGFGAVCASVVAATVVDIATEIYHTLSYDKGYEDIP
ncbi:hypothetical protein GTQ40_16030 [Flavobacteriaceae bacterium R38]|nr:hypothetical protein [Flavobacteriaceae bacterium R38]